MALKTTAERLEEVQAAISAVLSAQSFTFMGRSQTRADLAALREMEKELEAKLVRETRGGVRVRYGVPCP